MSHTPHLQLSGQHCRQASIAVSRAPLQRSPAMSPDALSAGQDAAGGPRQKQRGVKFRSLLLEYCPL